MPDAHHVNGGVNNFVAEFVLPDKDAPYFTWSELIENFADPWMSAQTACRSGECFY